RPPTPARPTPPPPPPPLHGPPPCPATPARPDPPGHQRWSPCCFPVRWFGARHGHAQVHVVRPIVTLSGLGALSSFQDVGAGVRGRSGVSGQPPPAVPRSLKVLHSHALRCPTPVTPR